MAKIPDLMKSKRTQVNSALHGMSPLLLLIITAPLVLRDHNPSFIHHLELGKSLVQPLGLKLTHRLGQATWITLVSLPAILVNTIPRAAHPALGIRDLVGVGIWAGGLGLEILADSRMSISFPPFLLSDSFRSHHTSCALCEEILLLIGRKITMAS